MNIESPENKGVDSAQKKMASGSTFTISSKYLKTERKGGRVKESHSLGFLKTKLLWKPFWRRLRKSPGDPGERRVIPFLLKQFSGNSPSVQGSKTKVYSGKHQRLYLRIFDRGSETQIWEHFRNQPVFPCQKVSSISPPDSRFAAPCQRQITVGNKTNKAHEEGSRQFKLPKDFEREVIDIYNFIMWERV